MQFSVPGAALLRNLQAPQPYPNDLRPRAGTSAQKLDLHTFASHEIHFFAKWRNANQLSETDEEVLMRGGIGCRPTQELTECALL
ncbi:hypothetical protein LZ30DRAFT_696272 [Colletotrichum cereale]|nr:hypothetical protein LZ30DRAFT_696272 [Colletotrichum cereale]